MKILITNAYARGSGGDMAILESLIAELGRVFPEAEITVATIDEPAHLGEIFPDVRCVSSLITTVWQEEDGRLGKLLGLLRSFLSAFLWAGANRRLSQRPDWLLKESERESMRALADSDLVVGVGGGYIREEPGMLKVIDLALTLRLIYLSHLLGKKTVLYSQSIGPFGDRMQEALARHVLRKMQLIITRESVSRKLLHRLGVPDQLVMESTDCAFLLERPHLIGSPLERIAHDQGGPLIGVTARQWLDEEGQARYEREMAHALDEIILQYDARVVFIPQTTVERKEDDDRIVEERIFAQMGQKKSATCLTGAYTHQQLMDIYGELDFLIGTRFHSAIFALTSRVPALVIAYEHKAVGIMQDLGLERYVLDIREVNAPLLTGSFARLYQEEEGYLSQLDLALVKIREKARGAADRIRELYGPEQTKQLVPELVEIDERHEHLSAQESPSDTESAPGE